jgi:hypothetical protein
VSFTGTCAGTRRPPLHASIVFALVVADPSSASTRPSTVAAALSETSVRASRLPTNVVPAPRVALAPPTCQNTLELRRRIGDVSGWVQAYDKYVSQLPASDLDWQTNELSMLGRLRVQGMQLSDLIAAVPSAANDVELTKSVVQLEWPEFDQLCALAQEKWLLGVTFLSNPRVSNAVGGMQWSLASSLFAEALRAQLTQSVVGPFVMWLKETDQLRWLYAQLERVSEERRALRHLESGTGTLGQVVRLLDDARIRREDSDLSGTVGCERMG